MPGQPYAPVTDPDRIPHQDVTAHTCGWCGGVNSHTNRVTCPFRVLCHSCMRDEFGSHWAYDSFIRSQRARTRARERKWRTAAGKERARTRSGDEDHGEEKAPEPAQESR